MDDGLEALLNWGFQPLKAWSYLPGAGNSWPAAFQAVEHRLEACPTQRATRWVRSFGAPQDDG